MAKPDKRKQQTSSSSHSNSEDAAVGHVTEIGENDVPYVSCLWISIGPSQRCVLPSVLCFCLFSLLLIFSRLGRGAPLLKLPGHRRFRQLVAADKAEYMASNKHAVKDQIAERIYNKIANERGGKFLRKVDSDVERRQLGIPRKTDAWVEVEKSAAMNKIKQSLREQQSSTSRVAKSSHAHGVQGTASSTTGEDESPSPSPSPQKRRPLPTGKQQSSSSSLESTQIKRRETSATVAASRPTSTAAAYVPGVASLPRPHIESPRDVQFAGYKRPQSAVLHSSSESEDSSDFEFRMKHPSLRKRDKLLLRREQYRRATSGGGESSTGSAASVSSSTREQKSDPSKRQLVSEGKLEESDEGDVETEDRKPSAK